MLLGVLSAGGVFAFRYFSRDVQCLEGEFIGPSNQCLACFPGCLRCESSDPSECTRCGQDMYLVVTREEDSEGSCFKECRGRVIRAFVCL